MYPGIMICTNLNEHYPMVPLQKLLFSWLIDFRKNILKHQQSFNSFKISILGRRNWPSASGEVAKNVKVYERTDR